MGNKRLLLTTLCLQLLFWPALTQAAENFVLRGQIVDTANRPVAGAEVYIFDSANVKRPADFISNRTGSDGFYRVAMPSGHYWSMAILRTSGASFGPLAKEDKHSGEPLEIDSAAIELIKDFTVMDLREAARANQKRSESVVKITGHIFDSDGLPVAMAYAFADPRQKSGTIPNYISAWTETDGSYILYLPAGKIFIGANKDFPPPSDYLMTKEVNFKIDTEDVDLVIN